LGKGVGVFGIVDGEWVDKSNGKGEGDRTGKGDGTGK